MHCVKKLVVVARAEALTKDALRWRMIVRLKSTRMQGLYGIVVNGLGKRAYGLVFKPTKRILKYCLLN